MHTRIKVLSHPDFLQDDIDPGVTLVVLEIKFEVDQALANQK